MCYGYGQMHKESKYLLAEQVGGPPWIQGGGQMEQEESKI